MVTDTIRRHCAIRRWELFALHVGEVHVHVVVSAEKPADVAMSELKAWCSRRLAEASGKRPHWWTEGGNRKRVGDERGLVEVTAYVAERQ